MPANLLSNPINVFGPLLLVGFLTVLLWLGYDRWHSYTQQHHFIAVAATKNAANEIENHLGNLQRLLQIFVEYNHQAINTLAENKKNEQLRLMLDARLKTFFPDYFAFTIADARGVPLISDFEGNVGELCVEDMKQAVTAQTNMVRVHPNPHIYHIDIMVNFQSRDGERIFLVSFALDKFAQILTLASPESHKLALIHPGQHELIEITENGGRDKLTSRESFWLNQPELDRLLGQEKVNGTSWYVYDFIDQGVIWRYTRSLIYEGLVLYLAFCILVILMWRLICKYEARRRQYENELVAKNEEIVKLNDELQFLSITDDLTGLKNRRYLTLRLQEELNRAKRKGSALAIALVDIDYFKQYNDRYGHQAGDECLKTVARIMLQHIKRANEFAARYGGEEFAVVMNDVDNWDVCAEFEQLRASIEEACIPHSGSKIHESVTVSIGVVRFVAEQGTEAVTYLKQADAALYEAKGSGRNRVVCSDTVKT